jgi:hypothetical protein
MQTERCYTDDFKKATHPLTPSLSPSDGERVADRPGEGLARATVLIGTLLTIFLLLTGCTTTPRTQTQRAPNSFPADALITQRGVLTVLGRQFTLNGYLASSSTNGQRLIVTENFGSVLADVIVKPDGKAYVMRSSRAFKPKWIERYIAADVQCLFGNSQQTDYPGQMVAPNHFLIERRWYKLDLHIVETKPGMQPAEMFDITKALNH